jgi:hypothetical protein
VSDAAVVLIDADLPDFGEPTVEPEIPTATYAARMAAAMARAQAAGFDALVVYGDREHAANLAFLTGYDPRFEEALLVAVPGRAPALMVGNEGWGYAGLMARGVLRVLCQSFSLPGQSRDRNPPLGRLLAEAGLAPGMAAAAAGWKPLGPADHLDDAALDLPDWIAAALRAAIAPARPRNANGLFMDPADGLRAVNDVDQLARFEFAATFASQGVRNVLFGLRPGMTEIAAARLMAPPGLPLSAHAMLSAGPRAAYGLPSPSLRPIARGEPFTVALGLQGGLSARAGWVAAGPQDLPAGVRDYVERLATPYWGAVAAWWETVGIGVEGGALWTAAMARLGDPFFGVGLNPGHLIHLDEWLHSPVVEGGRIPLRSGMALQVDIIPATGTPWHTANAEDGLALADEGLRAEFAARWPEAWARIEARRRFMTETLGLRLKPEVLPFSNLAGWMPPFVLSPGRGFALRR